MGKRNSTQKKSWWRKCRQENLAGLITSTTHSREWKQEYTVYCKSRGLSINDKSAEAYIELKQQQLEEALENGDA